MGDENNFFFKHYFLTSNATMQGIIIRLAK